jgi:preprotein translocase subunit SecD
MNYKTIIMFLLLTVGIFYSSPTFFNLDYNKKINLGLDLQGGLYMLLDVKTENIEENSLKSLKRSVKNITEKQDILIEGLNLIDNKLKFEVLDEDDIIKIKSALLKFDGLQLDIIKNNIILSYKEEYIKELKTISFQKTLKVIRNRLNLYGLSEPTVSKKGDNNILIELPGIKTQEEEQRARELIVKQAKLEIVGVLEGYQKSNMTNEYAASHGGKLVNSKNPLAGVLLINETPLITGEMIIDANVGFDKNNKPVINYTLNSEGASLFGDYTAAHLNERTAIILDGINVSAPYIRDRIGGGHVQISGNYDIHEATNLAIALRSGALDTKVELLEKRSIGPSLGEESIRKSLMALLFGFLLVFIFMIYYYRLSGLIANIALFINLLIIISIMVMFGATLTLPGMAGIVLTVGMAVDANVIIMERIKELIKEGRTLTQAVEEGYDRALTSILDANITTFIASILLYAYGSGPIKGFALTMMIGISISMITGIFGTKGFYEAIDLNKKTPALFNIKGKK